VKEVAAKQDFPGGNLMAFKLYCARCDHQS